MPNFTYEAEVKKRIVTDVATARKTGQSWQSALELARMNGYKGSLGGLVQMMRNATKKKKSKRPVPISATKTTPKAAAPVKEKFANGIGPIIESAINKEVGVRMNALLDKAIQALVSAKK